MITNHFKRLNCLDTFSKIENAVREKIPFSLVRLGDGEGALMGYPSVTDRSAINRSFNVWFGHASFDESEAAFIAEKIRCSVKNADVVGIPREKQVKLHPYYGAVFKAMKHYELTHTETLYTDAAIHRYFQFCLLYRKLLSGKPFLGLVSSRDVGEKLKRTFNIHSIKQHLIKGEAKFVGNIKTPHFPDSYNELFERISPPYRGAIYLVGAGGLRKSYCNIIKERGGIAIDIGALFDAWANVKSRLVHPAHSFDCYEAEPVISGAAACDRFNDLCDHFEIDTDRLDADSYKEFTNSTW